MSYRKTSFAHGEYYHIYNRGNSKQCIFRDSADYRRFQDMLFLGNSSSAISVRNARRGDIYDIEQDNPLVAIGAYCLMPNHFHILLTPMLDEGISQFIQKISTGYAMYFNKRYERTGSLFEGKFKSSYVEDDTYLKYLFSYIHLNPLKLKHKDWMDRIHKQRELLLDAVQYPFSSLQDYLSNTRKQGIIINPDFFPTYYQSVNSINAEMLDWITLKTD